MSTARMAGDTLVPCNLRESRSRGIYLTALQMVGQRCSGAARVGARAVPRCRSAKVRILPISLAPFVALRSVEIYPGLHKVSIVSPAELTKFPDAALWQVALYSAREEQHSESEKAHSASTSG